LRRRFSRLLGAVIYLRLFPHSLAAPWTAELNSTQHRLSFFFESCQNFSSSYKRYRVVNLSFLLSLKNSHLQKKKTQLFSPANLAKPFL